MDERLRGVLTERLKSAGEKTLLVAIARVVNASGSRSLSARVHLAPLSLEACEGLDKVLDEIGSVDGVDIGWMDPDEHNLDAPAVELAKKMGARICAVAVFTGLSESVGESLAHRMVGEWASLWSALGPFHASYPNKGRVICEALLAQALPRWEASELQKEALSPRALSRAPGL